MEYVLSIVILLTIYLILATSLNVVLGHGGLLSLCHAGFYAIGAYAAALTGINLGWSFLPTAAAAVAIAAAVAALLALPLLKLRGDYFILGSLGFQIIIIDIIYNSDWLTNGALGLSRIPRPRISGFEAISHLDYALLYGAVALIAIAVLHYITTSPFGGALNAVREDEVAATALGKNVRSIRVRAFAISAGGAGLAGALYAHYVTYIDPTSFTFTESVYILSLVIVGGVATTRGPILGALLLVAAPEMLRFVGFSSDMDSNLRQLLYGLLLILFAFVRPSGIAGRSVF
ncbi:MAG: branched-chain amino acid ABC transporter permease [Bradyrhizobiaceae bacterium]|nr:branched-chain amino acid ABC transporter permease [Bradyrhizobiaceae bacterium]